VKTISHIVFNSAPLSL